MALRQTSAVQEAGLEPDIKYMNTLIEAMGRNGDLQSALAALADLRASGLVPNAGTVEACVEACLACGDIERARSMHLEFADVRRSSALGVPDMPAHATVHSRNVDVHIVLLRSCQFTCR